MGAEWQHQLRRYLADGLAVAARADPASPAFRPLAEVLEAHGAAMVSQLDAFEDYVAGAEREGPEKYRPYRWTKATLDDPAKRLKHMRAFAVCVSGREVYPKETADALEAALRPLVDGRLVERLSRHNTNPASNPTVPAEYRS